MPNWWDTIPEEVKVKWRRWIAVPRDHTCTCSHVEWAHYVHTTGICMHCPCRRYNGKPNPVETTSNA
jgi:hypothetical protein